MRLLIYFLPVADFCSCGIPRINNGDCARCSKQIDPVRLALIEKNKTESISDSNPLLLLSPPKTQKRVQNFDNADTKSAARDDEKELTETQQIVSAVNRTTHAVRAFVLFLFYQLTALTLAFVMYFFAQIAGNSNDECSNQLRSFNACSPNAFLVFIALVIWIVGVFYSSNVGWREIKKSEVHNK